PPGTDDFGTAFSRRSAGRCGLRLSVTPRSRIVASSPPVHTRRTAPYHARAGQPWPVRVWARSHRWCRFPPSARARSARRSLLAPAPAVPLSPQQALHRGQSGQTLHSSLLGVTTFFAPKTRLTSRQDSIYVQSNLTA